MVKSDRGGEVSRSPTGVRGVLTRLPLRRAEERPSSWDTADLERTPQINLGPAAACTQGTPGAEAEGPLSGPVQHLAKMPVCRLRDPSAGSETRLPAKRPVCRLETRLQAKRPVCRLRDQSAGSETRLQAKRPVCRLRDPSAGS
ncbi:hypothetical protein NHX12_013281 [Muraenolepis orangiensis]|uniref:Uncharacterized protein n=1 Tax=Muraenolepis orangiensis TaxID=630683 RepID=A0A9Q0DEE7_9TELE|nr:hypothetical protein NHX12_013281 [Muraenolepis orangiensis]